MKISTIIATILIALPMMANADDTLLGEYVKYEFTDSLSNRMPYRLLSPRDIQPGANYPLIVFLHGSGEAGDDNQSQLEHGADLFLQSDNMAKYPSYVLFPQCEEKTWTGKISQRSFMPGAEIPPLSKEESTLMHLIYSIIDEHPIDLDRIYIVGLSMGGIAVYDLACRYPQLFAAAVPICGAVNPERLPVQRA